MPHIPKTINVTDTNKNATIDVEIIGYGGYELTDFTNLEVEVSVASAEGYHLKGINGNANGDTTPEYQVVFDDQKLNTATGKAETKINGVKLGNGGDTVTKIGNADNATLTKGGKKAGQYKDTLTFTFDEVKNSMTGVGM